MKIKKKPLSDAGDAGSNGFMPKPVVNQPGPLQNTSWNLYRDGVTQGFINSFMTCREQTRLHYVEGYSSKSTSLWFNFGSCIHEVLSKCYAEDTPPLPGHLLCMIKSYQEKKEKEAGGTFNDYEWEDQEIIYGVAEALLPVYIEKYKDDWNNNWVINETAFNIPYRFRDGRGTSIRGRIDGGFIDERHKTEAMPYGRLTLLDTKNLSVFDEGILEASLPFDTQCMMYLWAVRKMMEEANLKRQRRGMVAMNPLPSEFIYNVIRRPQLRRGKKETLKEFVVRVNTDIFSRPEHYLIRFPMQVDLREIDYWEKHQLVPIMQQIQAWWDTGCSGDLHWLNPGALTSKYGPCSMFDLITRGDTRKYFKKTVPFPELVDNPDTMPPFVPVSPQSHPALLDAESQSDILEETISVSNFPTVTNFEVEDL